MNETNSRDAIVRRPARLAILSLALPLAALLCATAVPAALAEPARGPREGLVDPGRMSPTADELVARARQPGLPSFERQKLHAGALESMLDHAIENVRALHRLAGLAARDREATVVRAAHREEVARSFVRIEQHLAALRAGGPDVARSRPLAAFDSGWSRAKLDWRSLHATADPLAEQARLELVHRNLVAARRNLIEFGRSLGMRRLERSER